MLYALFTVTRAHIIHKRADSERLTCAARSTTTVALIVIWTLTIESRFAIVPTMSTTKTFSKRYCFATAADNNVLRHNNIGTGELRRNERRGESSCFR